MSMNLLALTTSYPTEADPFRGPFIERWADQMQTLGANVRVIGPATKDPLGRCPYVGFRDIGGLLRGSGAPDEIQTKPLWGSVRGAAITLEMVKTTRRLITDVDSLVCHWLLPSVYAGLAAAIRTEIPVHGYAHGGDISLIEAMPRTISKRICQVADRQCRSVIFVSEDLRARFNSLLDRPPRAQQKVIPMGICRADADPAFREWLKIQANGRPIVATLGRHVEIKGLDLVFDALKDQKDLLWVAAGDGPYRNALEEHARYSPLDICLPGMITPAQREALFEEATVFVQSSRQIGTRTEGHPVALIEALAAGVPSVVNPSGGISEIALKADCIPVDVGDSEAFQTAIIRLINNEKHRSEMSLKHQQYAQEQTWDKLGPAHFEAVCSVG
ncbi:MAG: hypothetical protein CMH52_01690 [Myxococcales bacterium]|nr:hypothetical protein [Myxococcales bacterium]